MRARITRSAEAVVRPVVSREAVSALWRAFGLTTAILCTTSATAEFFCFEPVSHPVDAHNLPGYQGLAVCVSRESLNAEMTFDWT